MPAKPLGRSSQAGPIRHLEIGTPGPRFDRSNGRHSSKPSIFVANDALVPVKSLIFYIQAVACGDKERYGKLERRSPRYGNRLAPGAFTPHNHRAPIRSAKNNVLRRFEGLAHIRLQTGDLCSMMGIPA
jgi:hypothetical protein